MIPNNWELQNTSQIYQELTSKAYSFYIILAVRRFAQAEIVAESIGIENNMQSFSHLLYDLSIFLIWIFLHVPLYDYFVSKAQLGVTDSIKLHTFDPPNQLQSLVHCADLKL